MDVKKFNPKSLKSMEMLSLTSRSFSSSPAPLILPSCTGTQVCSDVWIQSGQPCSSLGRCTGTGAGIFPLPLTYTPLHLRNHMKTALLSQGLSGPLQAMGTLVLSPSSLSPPTVPMGHCCLGHCGVSGLHCRCSPCTSN